MAYTTVGTTVFVWCAGFTEEAGIGLAGLYRSISVARKTDTITDSGSGIGTLTAVSLDGISVAEIDVTSLQDTARRYINGTIEHGTLSIEYIAGTGKNFNTYFPNTGSNRSMYLKTTFGSVGQVFYVLAVPQSFTMDAAVDDAIRGTITFRILDLGDHLLQSAAV